MPVDVAFEAQPILQVWHSLLSGKYVLCYSNEILAEYEEILTLKMGASIASNIISAILNLPNALQVQVYFHLHLIAADPDDDKFVDCAFKSNARFIVTQDHHYDVLQALDFPRIDVVDIDKFVEMLNDA